MSTLSYSESISIAATPDEVYALISDPTRIGESSPVCREITWTEGVAGEVGSLFTGRNEVAGRSWETANKVIVADGRSFGWSTGPGIAEWVYSVAEGAEAGTSTLTESWEFSDAGQDAIRAKFPERAEAIIAGSEANTQAGISATLAAMKQILEGVNA